MHWYLVKKPTPRSNGKNKSKTKGFQDEPSSETRAFRRFGPSQILDLRLWHDCCEFLHFHFYRGTGLSAASLPSSSPLENLVKLLGFGWLDRTALNSAPPREGGVTTSGDYLGTSFPTVRIGCKRIANNAFHCLPTSLSGCVSGNGACSPDGTSRALRICSFAQARRSCSERSSYSAVRSNQPKPRSFTRFSNGDDDGRLAALNP